MLSQESQRNLQNNLFQRIRNKRIDSTDDQLSSEKQFNQKSQKINKNKYKTEMCKNFSEMGFCPYRNKCQFAHGQSQICHVEPPAKKFYRTRKCYSFWNQGLCNYGFRCQFSHYHVSQETLSFLSICRSVFSEANEGESRLLKILELQN